MNEQRNRMPAGRDARYGLEEALDGELPEDVVARMTRHTEDCPECADEWHRLRILKELLRRSCAGDVAPRSLRERLSADYRGSASVTQVDSVTRVDVDGSSTTVSRSVRYEQR